MSYLIMTDRHFIPGPLFFLADSFDPSWINTPPDGLSRKNGPVSTKLLSTTCVNSLA
jgi:hypothetical protein